MEKPSNISQDSAGLLPQGVPSHVVDEDLPCAFCNYNLRSLSPETVCPECGSPVSKSIQATQSIYLDLGWSKCTFIGTFITLVTLVGLAGGLIIFISTLGYGGHVGRPSDVVNLILYTIPILLACGAWLATRKCERDQTLCRLDSRKACRFSIVWMMLLHAILCADYFMQTDMIEDIGEELTGACYSVFFVSYLLCLLRYLTHITGRSTNKLTGWGQVAFWSLFGFSAIMFLIAAPSRTDADVGNGLVPLLGILALIALLTLISVFIFLLGMSVSLWLDFQKAQYFMKSHAYPESMKMRHYADEP